jgi:hypothetical protein
MAKNIQESEEKEEPQPIVEQEIEQIIEQEIEPILASTTVVLDNVYADSTEAKWRVKKLHQLGLEAQLGNISDYELDLNINNDYFVFLEDAEGELRLLFDKYKKKLFDEDVEVINAKIIEIKKKTTGKESKEIDR